MHISKRFAHDGLTLGASPKLGNFRALPTSSYFYMWWASSWSRRFLARMIHQTFERDPQFVEEPREDVCPMIPTKCGVVAAEILVNYAG